MTDQNTMRWFLSEGVGNMLCHMVIDLSKILCTKSDDRTKLVQR